jgi:hypothetical protein
MRGAIQLDVVENQDGIGLDEQQVPPELPDALSGRVGRGCFPCDVVKAGPGFGRYYGGEAGTLEIRTDVQPLLAFTHLSGALD